MGAEMLPTAGMLTRDTSAAGEEPGCRELGLEVVFDFKAAHGTNISPSPTRSSESQARTEGAGRDESSSAGVRPELTCGLCASWVHVCRGWHCHPTAGDSTEPPTQPQGVAGPTCQGGRVAQGPARAYRLKGIIHLLCLHGGTRLARTVGHHQDGGSWDCPQPRYGHRTPKGVAPLAV